MNQPTQFRVLFRQFLFRTVDLELIAPQGDMSKLLGQFAGLLVFVSFATSLGGLLFNGSRLSHLELVDTILRTEHFLISTTMLVVGLFAVLSWDSTFPDRRDVLVLAPLPVRARTLFLAKIAAIGAALSITVIALNSLISICWPIVFISINRPGAAGVLGVLRAFAAYWTTSFAAGIFIFGAVLTLQGVAAQLLSRRVFLRVSAFLQMAAFCLFLSTYFLEPSLTTPAALAAAANQSTLAWLPSYWFFGLFQALNGSLAEAANSSPAAYASLVSLAQHAVGGIAIAAIGTASAFLLSYLRTLRKIVEEPDIMPSTSRIGWTPRFGSSLQTAVVLFSIRTLLRSRQHRVMLAFYLGIGFALVILLMKAPAQENHLNHVDASLMFASIIMMSVLVSGTRIVFSLPLDLRANWIFRVTQVRGAAEYLAASRRPLFVLAVIPVWAICAAVLFALWPWPDALRHLIVLGVFGILIAYAGLYGFHKIPFTCSYLPGKRQAHLAFVASLPIFVLIAEAVVLEMRALHDSVLYLEILATLCVAVVLARWLAIWHAASDEAAVQFEETPVPAIQVLGLLRDGHLPP